MPTILLKRNSVSGFQPAIDEIELGEISVNTADGVLYTKTFKNGVFEIVSVGVSELEKVENQTGTRYGWRLKTDTPENFLDTGDFSVTLSQSSDPQNKTGASGDFATTFGNNTTASGIGSTAEGLSTQASGEASHAEGTNTIASGGNAHAEGSNTVASNGSSHAEGESTRAEANASHAEGRGTIAQNEAMHAAGRYNVGTATGTIHETGIGTGPNDKKNAFEIYTDGRVLVPELTLALINESRCLVTKEYVDANAGGGELIKDGDGYRIKGLSSGTLGINAVNLALSGNATGNYSFISGTDTRADGVASSALGYSTRASGFADYAEGYHAEASGTYGSHAEGRSTSASGNASHAEGRGTTASGTYSHAEGYSTRASNITSHSEGYGTEASGYYSHAENRFTKAQGGSSHAEGLGTIAQNSYMHAAGIYNIGTATDTIHETGIGTNDTTRKNAFEIYTDGRVLVPELTTTLIDNDTTGRILTTKEWVQANAGGGGGNLLSDGSIPMDAGYTPTNNQDIATKNYIDTHQIDGGIF